MPRESPSDIQDRIDTLSDQIADEQDPAKIRYLTKELISWESELQKIKKSKKYTRTKTKSI